MNKPNEKTNGQTTQANIAVLISTAEKAGEVALELSRQKQINDSEKYYD